MNASPPPHPPPLPPGAPSPLLLPGDAPLRILEAIRGSFLSRSPFRVQDVVSLHAAVFHPRYVVSFEARAAGGWVPTPSKTAVAEQEEVVDLLHQLYLAGWIRPVTLLHCPSTWWAPTGVPLPPWCDPATQETTSQDPSVVFPWVSTQNTQHDAQDSNTDP